jgi:hypothetical protein
MYHAPRGQDLLDWPPSKQAASSCSARKQVSDEGCFHASGDCSLESPPPVRQSNQENVRAGGKQSLCRPNNSIAKRDESSCLCAPGCCSWTGGCLAARAANERTTARATALAQGWGCFSNH